MLPELKTGRNNAKYNGNKSIELYSPDIKDILKAIIISVGFMAVTAYLFYENIFAMLLLSPVGILCYIRQISSARLSKMNELRMQFKDAMTAVSFSLNVGYSLENSFYEALHELKTLYKEDSIIVKEFTIIVNRVARNEKLEDALYDFAKKSEIEDIVYFAEVFRYAKVSGGNMISIIKNTVRTISEKIETENEIQIVISGKKMEQKIMSFIPFVIIGYLKLTSPGFLSGLYNNIIGACVMTGCLLLYLLAVELSRRIVNITV